MESENQTMGSPHSLPLLNKTAPNNFGYDENVNREQIPNNRNRKRFVFVLSGVIAILILVVISLAKRNTFESNKDYSSQKIPLPVTSPNTIAKVDSYVAGIALIDEMESSSKIPEMIALPSGATFNLYHYKEPKIAPYCEVSQDESCKLEAIFGDYSKENGYNCEGNPFFNSLNKEINKIGHYNSEDAELNTVVSINNFFTVIKTLGYELFTGSTYETFLLKDQNNMCHPYKYNANYLKKGTPPSNRPNLTTVKFNVTDEKIANNNYSKYVFGCAGSMSLLVENNLAILPFLNKAAETNDKVIIYTLKPTEELNENLITLYNFSKSVTTPEIQDGGYAVLPVKSISNDVKVNFLNQLSNDKTVIFVSDPLFPQVLFVYVSINNVLFPGC